MRFPLTIERLCDAPPASVVTALRDMGQLRESAMPDELRREGLLALEISVRGAQLTAHYYVGRGRYLRPRLRAVVSAHPRGARVVARCERSPLVFGIAAVLTPLALFSTLRTGQLLTGFSALVLACWVFGLVMYFTYSNREAAAVRYLTERFHIALDSLGSTAGARAAR